MKNTHFYSLDLLRSIAILHVVVMHGASIFLQNSNSIVNLFISVFLKYNVGVPLFFILSGFLMAYKLDSNKDIYGFYRRRFAKIYPTYFVYITILFFMSEASWGDYFAHVLGVHNWFFEYSYSLSPQFWSLAVEMQFYLLIPYVYEWSLRNLSVAKMLGWLLVLLGIVFFLLNQFGMAQTMNEKVVFLYSHTILNIGNLFWGVILFRRYKMNSLSKKMSGTLFAIMSVYTIVQGMIILPDNNINNIDFSDPYKTIGVIWIMLLWQCNAYLLAELVLQIDVPVQGSIKIIAWSSYQWYLLHIFILDLIFQRCHFVESGVAFSIYIAGSLFAAYLVTKYLEQPLLRLFNSQIKLYS